MKIKITSTDFLEARNHKGQWDETMTNHRFHRYPNNIEVLIVMTWSINYDLRQPKIDYQGKYRHWFKIGAVYIDQFDLPRIGEIKYDHINILDYFQAIQLKSSETFYTKDNE